MHELTFIVRCWNETPKLQNGQTRRLWRYRVMPVDGDQEVACNTLEDVNKFIDSYLESYVDL